MMINCRAAEIWKDFLACSPSVDGEKEETEQEFHNDPEACMTDDIKKYLGEVGDVAGEGELGEG